MPIKGMPPKEVMHTEMSKFKEGTLHSGSKKGPKVKSRAQAIAIGLSESGQAKKDYDRSSHHKGNPGFPSSNSSSPPGLNESQTTTDPYRSSVPHTFNAPAAAHADGFRAGQRNDGVLRNSGHPKAHRIGKRK